MLFVSYSCPVTTLWLAWLPTALTPLSLAHFLSFATSPANWGEPLPNCNSSVNQPTIIILSHLPSVFVRLSIELSSATYQQFGPLLYLPLFDPFTCLLV